MTASAVVLALSFTDSSTEIWAMIAINVSGLWKKRLGDWGINPYVGCQHGCRHCYAPTMPGVRFHNGGLSQAAWGTYLKPKAGIVDALRRQLKHFTPDRAHRTEWGGGWILMSFLTDAYTLAESSHRFTQQCLQMILDAGHKVRLLTRSALVERDFPILQAHPGRVLLGTSLPHLNDGLARVLEPRASSPTRRLRMLENARSAGIPTFVAVAPYLPGHSLEDLEELIRRVRPLVTAEVFCEVLNPKGTNLKMMVDALTAVDPHRLALEAYSPRRWSEHTWSILSAGAKLTPAWVPWPDTKRGWRKHLSREQSRTLDGWLPPSK